MRAGQFLFSFLITILFHEISHANDLFRYLEIAGIRPQASAAETLASLKKLMNQSGTAVRRAVLDVDQDTSLVITQITNNNSRSLQKVRDIFQFKEVEKVSPQDVIMSIGDGVPGSTLSFSPGVDHAESQSFNRLTGKYEFDIIDFSEKNVGDKEFLRKNSQQSCVTCHQHGGQILSGVPWNEFTDSFVFPLDGAIRKDNDTLQAQQICRHLNAEDPDFLKKLVELKKLLPLYDDSPNDRLIDKLSTRILSEEAIPKGSDLKVKDYEQAIEGVGDGHTPIPLADIHKLWNDEI